MSSDYLLYILVLVAVVAGVLIIKKVASCLIKTIVLVVVLAIAAFVYFSTMG